MAARRVALLSTGASRRSTVAGLAPVLVAAVAVAWPLVRVARAAAASPGAFWFGADGPEMELRTLAAARGHLALGSFSVYGWQHPGPALYYWFAPFYAALGREPAGMIVATVVANVAGLTGLVALIGWCGGRRSAWIAVVAVLAFLWRFGLEGLWVSWNPNLTVVPMALLVVATAAVLSGRRWAVPLVVLLASWTVQAHLGTAIVVAGLVLLAAVGGWRAARGDDDGGQAGRRAWRGPGLAGAAIALVLWTPALVDQFGGSGNMSTVLGYMVRGEPGPDAPTWTPHPEPAFTPWEAVKEVGLVGSLLSSHETGRFVGPDRSYALRIRNRGSLAAVFVALVVANAAVAWRRRHRRDLSAPLAGTVALAGLLTCVSAMSARGNPSHHIVAFAAGVGLVAWLALALAAVDHVAERWPARWTPPPPPDRGAGWHGALAVAAACLLLVFVTVTLPLVRRPFGLIDVDIPEVAAIVEAIGPRPGERIVVDADRTADGLLLLAVLDLAVDDHDVRVTEEWQVYFTAEQDMPTTWDRSVYLDLPGGPPIASAWRARGTVRDGAGRNLRVLVRPGPSPFPSESSDPTEGA